MLPLKNVVAIAVDIAMQAHDAHAVVSLIVINIGKKFVIYCLLVKIVLLLLILIRGGQGWKAAGKIEDCSLVRIRYAAFIVQVTRK